MSEVIVDAKFLSPKPPLSLSGKQLFWVLVGSLTLTIVMVDTLTGQGLLSLESLGLPFLASALGVSGLGHWVIPLLRRMKAGQFIREDGPQSHLQKSGTPTMGGIFVLPVGVTIALAASQFNPQVLAISLLTLSYGFIGWLDDWQILRHKSNKGISPQMKLLLQVGFGSLFCGWLAWSTGSLASITTIALPWGASLGLGLLFWPLCLFVLTAESNATNLTDGLDGLAAGTGSLSLMGLGLYIAPDYPAVAIFCLALGGAYLGFLSHNRNPAKVFMGDTGSLALGGALGAVGIITNSLWVLFVMGGLFFVESLSVVLQVGYYKVTKNTDGVGKRLLKMAPYHHHLELSGWSETQIVSVFYGVTATLIVLCLAVKSLIV